MRDVDRVAGACDFNSKTMQNVAAQISSKGQNRVFSFTDKFSKHLERLQLSQTQARKTIGRWYRRHLGIGVREEVASAIDGRDKTERLFLLLA